MLRVRQGATGGRPARVSRLPGSEASEERSQDESGVRAHHKDGERAVLNEFVIVVPRATPSVNEWHGRHWSRYHKRRKVWMDEFGLAFGHVTRRAAATLPAKPAGRRSVTVTRLMEPGDRRFDLENLVAGCKPIIDALKRLGVLHNDSPRWLEHHAEQRHAEAGEPAPGTLITIRDLPHHGRRDACRG